MVLYYYIVSTVMFHQRFRRMTTSRFKEETVLLSEETCPYVTCSSDLLLCDL